MQTGGDDRRLGDILVGLGVISRRELDRQLKAQIEEAVFELLRWSEGYFRFEEGAPVPRGGRGAGPVPDRGAADGGGAAASTSGRASAPRSRTSGWSRGCPPPEAQGSEPLDLVPFEWEVLAAVDGARDLHSLAEVLGRSEFEVARTVYGLTNAGIVVLDDPAHPGQEAGAGPRSGRAAGAGARGAGAGRSTTSRPARSRRCCGATRSCPRRAGCSASCYAALGPLRRGARAVGRRGAGWATARRAKRRRAPSVERLRQAAETIMRELERYRD